MEKVAIYVRLSKEDENVVNESESIVNQKNLLTQYAKEHNMEIFGVYSDEDYSGLDINRPGFKKMIDDAAAGRFNIVLCKTISRFTRDLSVIEKYIHGLFIQWGIRFISVVDNVDTSVKANKKARQIYGLINEWYCEDLSDNIRAVFKRKMEDGQYIGSFAAYGYKKSEQDRHKLAIDEDAAKTVKKVFELYLQGNSCADIARILTGSGVLTPSEYKKAQGLRFVNPGANTVWSKNTIKKILRNKTYIGQLIQGKETKLSYKSSKIVSVPKTKWIVAENSHHPIIDDETFYKVQELLDKNRRVTSHTP